MMMSPIHAVPARPVIGVLCCNEVAGRPVQVVASRFVEPLATIAGATVLLIPAIPGAADVATLSRLIDGLLLTGSRSNVAGHRYGGADSGGLLDEERDEVALSLAGGMIEAGKPVFGICRGLQELNVLFGGTLSGEAGRRDHHRGSWDGAYHELFDHRHDVRLADGGTLSTVTGLRRLTVNSVHEQGIDRLGGGLTVEAVAEQDGLVEAFSATPCGGQVLGVQWHPEWDMRSPGSRAFFGLVGTALRSEGVRIPYEHTRGGSLRGH